jgi:hypothetical protein
VGSFGMLIAELTKNQRNEKAQFILQVNAFGSKDLAEEDNTS